MTNNNNNNKIKKEKNKLFFRGIADCISVENDEEIIDKIIGKEHNEHLLN